MEIGPDLSGTQLVTGGSLTALVRKPQNIVNGKAYPVLIMLHGRGANEGDIYELVPFVDKRVMVVAVRAPFVNVETARGSFKWYELSAPRQPQSDLWQQSTQALMKFIDQLPDLTGIEVDPTQIYMGGFSQGASTTLMMAATYPEVLTGLILHSGFIAEESAKKLRQGVFHGKSAFVAHGTEDQTLTIEEGRCIRDVLQEGGVKVTYQEYPFAHSTSTASRRDLADWLNGRLRF